MNQKWMTIILNTLIKVRKRSRYVSKFVKGKMLKKYFLDFVRRKGKMYPIYEVLREKWRFEFILNFN